MTDQTPLKFGSVQIAKADVEGDGTQLHLNLLEGVVNKHELGMLIKFLQAKQETLGAPPQ